MGIGNIRKKLAREKPRLREEFGITSLSIFGSYAKGRQKKSSDLDILADFVKTPTIFQILRAERYLTEKAGIRVDLAYKKGLKEMFRKSIASQAVII